MAKKKKDEGKTTETEWGPATTVGTAATTDIGAMPIIPLEQEEGVFFTVENYIENLEPEDLLGLYLRVRHEIIKRMKKR